MGPAPAPPAGAAAANANLGPAADPAAAAAAVTAAAAAGPGVPTLNSTLPPGRLQNGGLWDRVAPQHERIHRGTSQNCRRLQLGK